MTENQKTQAESSYPNTSSGQNARFEEWIQLQAIDAAGRIRADMGDLDALVASIKEFGIIQPLVLARNPKGGALLVAGGRRYSALRKLNTPTLLHGRDYVWREEANDGTPENTLRFQAIELEENLRRKDLSWQEVVEGKQRLLQTMQRLHGVAEAGGRTRDEKRDGSGGYGVRKLAAMLGEDPSQTSRDLVVASAIGTPNLNWLRKEKDKTTVFNKVNILSILASGAKGASGGAGAVSSAIKAATAPAMAYKIVVDCVDEAQQKQLLERFVKEGIKCRALIS